MVPDPGSGRVGRPRAFDHDVVVACAMDVFWRHGYAQASIPDISAATGLSTSSIYNTFGSKQQLYLAALDRYLDYLQAHLLGPLESGTRGSEDIAAFLDALRAGARSRKGPRGCMATKAIAESGTSDADIVARTRRYRQSLRAALLAAFTRAARRGEIRAQDVDARAATLAGVVVAYNLLVGVGAPTAECMELLDAAATVALSKPGRG